MPSAPGSRVARTLLAAVLVVCLHPIVGCRGTAPSRTPVVLVTLDTTRQDRFGVYGDPAARTPEFDALARRGVLFRNAFVDAPTTLPSHATMMTGSNCLRHGVRINGAYSLPTEARTLAEVFGEAGYARAAVVSSAALASTYGLDQGFDEYADSMPDFYEAFDPVWSIRARRVAGNQRRAYQTNAAARTVLAELESPAFLWIHYIDAHQPDDPPYPWNRLPGVPPYSAEIAYVDRHMGRLLRDAESALGPPIVAVLADHGESTGEHRDDGHALFLYDATVRIPFTIAGPAVRSRLVSETVTNADLAPMLASAAGLRIEIYPDGTDRLAAGSAQPPAVFCETLAPTQTFGGAGLKSVRVDEWKYVHAPQPELYDLSVDPSELENLFDREPELAARLRASLERYVVETHHDSKRVPAPELHIDAVHRERLAALGYVVAGAPSVLEDLLGVEGVDPKDVVDVFWALRYIDDGLIEKARPRMQRFWAEHGSVHDPAWNPLLARAHYCEAVLAYVDGSMDGARDQIRRSVRLDPGFDDPRRLLLRITP